MRLYFKGHDYKYAAEQILLMMFPEERPEYPEKAQKEEENAAFIKLSKGGVYHSASVKLFFGGKTAKKTVRIKNAELTDKLTSDRLLQKIMKLAFYKAATQITGKNPVWGALTGIRPGKIVTRQMEKGVSAEKAARVLVKEYFATPERAELCKDTARASLDAKKLLSEKDIALYIGIPFCPTRCAYCSFVSNSVEKSMKLIEPFLEALYKEIDESAKLVKDLGLNVISVYMGGGTPTTLSADQMESLLKKLSESFDLSNVREFTIEAGRPDTITPEKLQAIEKGGADRVSINPQTMSDEVLRAIGRRHSAQQVVEAYGQTRENTKTLVNMDLIAGLPADTAESFRDTLDKVLSLGPENVTVHTLALKKGTKITLEGTKIPDENEVSEMLDYSVKRLREEGYYPYYLYRQKFMSGGFENVGWCREGAESLYNILIMEELCTILALGGGASTKLVAPETGHIERIFNPKYPLEYIQNIDSVNEKKKYMAEFYKREIFTSEEK